MNKLQVWMDKRRDSIILDRDKGIPVAALADKWGITPARVYQIYALKTAVISERLAEMPTLAQAEAQQADV